MRAPGQPVTLDWRGRGIAIDHAFIGETDPRRPLLVFLHEGLGSVSTWRDFPAKLCTAGGFRGLVYSRPGYGHSTPRRADEIWAPDFMHRQALEVLPALLERLGVDPAREAVWLFGHSDGASIALIHAASLPDVAHGVIAVAPHILVEDITIDSIRAACVAYSEGPLRARLAGHHDDPDSAFFGWSGAWLDPQFRSWSIENALASIRCPVLAVQGVDDAYGTLEQVRGIARRTARTRVLELADCGHSPHRDQPDALIAATVSMITTHHH
jgi:pimeloyl-ACP methyl ester carboxylesterase